MDDERPQEPDPSGGMHFLDHVEEVRKLIIACAVCLFGGIALVTAFIPWFADILTYPLSTATGQNETANQALITTGPMGVFSVILQLCFLGGLFIALPFMLYFVARFISPALHEHERKIIKPLCLGALIMFLIGSSFSYFLIVPASLKASMYFNEMLGFDPIWRADSYYMLLIWMVLGVGFAFEFPLVLLSLVYLHVFSSAQLRQFRPYSIVTFLILSAVLTPTTDPFTFLLLSVPMSVLYELSIWLSMRIEKKQNTAL